MQDRKARLSVYRLLAPRNGAFISPERYPGFAEQATSPPPFWDDVDASVALSLLPQARSTSFGYALDGPRAGDSLLLLAQSGRLYVDEPPDDPTDRPLTIGPAATAQLAWQAQPDGPPENEEPGEPGERALRLALAVPAPAIAVYCNPPCYLDRTAGVLGELTLAEPISASMMQWLRDAPPVPSEAAPEVALALHSSARSRPGLRRHVPPIPEQAVEEVVVPPRFVLGLFTTDGTPLRQRPRPGAGNRTFLAISLAVEYAGSRAEPLRLSTMAVQTAGGPRLVICDRQAEAAALAMLREEVGNAAVDEPGLTLAPEPRAQRRSGNVGGASTGWLTVAALPADGLAAARIKHELAGRLLALGWIIVDQAQLPTSLLEADDIVARLQPGQETGHEPGQETGQEREQETDAEPGEERGEDPGADRSEGPAGDGGEDRGGRNTPDWFRLQSGIQVGDRRIDLAPVLAAIIARGGFDAWKRACCPRAPLDEGFRHRGPSPRRGADRAAVARGRQLGPVAGRGHRRTDGVAEPLCGRATRGRGRHRPAGAGAKLRTWFESFGGIQGLQAPPSFRATLRPYQRDGLGWLQFLARAGLGGILADDMGLGKTVQVLAHVELERSAGRLAQPVLVVAPTSLVFNWQAEAARHAPALRVLALTGAGRSRRFGDLARTRPGADQLRAC